MRSYKRKEYILILIVLYTPVTLCNPCVNQTLNAIPYPNDCQAFLLCWLSHAYLQTCPNGLFFDIKTNNCQPLVTTTCCNVTLPILIIPVPIYQGSSVPTNKTNTRTPTTTKQTNSSTTPLLPTLKTNSTFITSSNQPEATSSIISILSTESPEFTSHVTEQREITTHLEPANIDIDVTKSTKLLYSSQPDVYKTSTITSYTEFGPLSTIIVSTDISEATTPIESTFWTDSRLTLSSGFTLNTTEKVITTPQTSTFVSELTKSEESKRTERQTYVSTSSAFVTSIDSSNKTPNSPLITATNPSQPTTPIIFTLWSEPTDSSETSSSSGTLDIELSTATLETTSTYINVTKKQSNQPNVYSTPPIVSSTEYSNYTHLTSTSNRNLPSVDIFNSTINPLNTEETHTSATSTIKADTIISSKTFPIITSDSFRTEPQTFTESSTWQPSFSSTINIVSSLNSSFFPLIYSTTELDETPKTTQYYRNKTSTTSMSSLSENTQAFITMVMPNHSTDFTENYENITRENLSTPVPSDKSFSPELKTDNIDFLTSSKKLSTDTFSTITATKSQIFTESSTLQPLVSSTANIVSSTKIAYSPTIISTTKQGQPSTTAQYSVEDTSTKSSPYFTEESVSTMTTEYIPATITSSSSQLETFNKTKLLTTTEHSLTAVTSQSLPLQLISSTNAPKSEITKVLSSLSESTEAKKHITTETETTFVTTGNSSSPIIFMNTVNSTWDPVTDKLASLPTNLKSTTDYTTIIPVTTVSTLYPSELNKNNNLHFTSTFQPKFTKTTKYDIENPSTTLKSFPINTEEKHRSAVTMEFSISTTEPTISTENNLYTDSETNTIQSIMSEEFKSTHSTLLPSITIFTSKSIISSPDTTTVKPIVTQAVRTLPPVPYSPPPCVFATTAQKSIIPEKTLPDIPPIVTSTYIAPEISTDSPFSKPVCGFWDKFVFPDESDCKHYYECLFGDIRKVSCRYGYEFNPYALKCMPHLEANCQRRKSSKEVLDFLYYIMKLNDLSASGPTEHS